MLERAAIGIVCMGEELDEGSWDAMGGGAAVRATSWYPFYTLETQGDNGGPCQVSLACSGEQRLCGHSFFGHDRDFYHIG